MMKWLCPDCGTDNENEYALTIWAKCKKCGHSFRWTTLWVFEQKILDFLQAVDEKDKAGLLYSSIKGEFVKAGE
jgi:ribosomal protein L37AE/L43A